MARGMVGSRNSGVPYFGTVVGSSDPPGTAADSADAHGAAETSSEAAPVTAPAWMTCLLVSKVDLLMTQACSRGDHARRRRRPQSIDDNRFIWMSVGRHTACQ